MQTGAHRPGQRCCTQGFGRKSDRFDGTENLPMAAAPSGFVFSFRRILSRALFGGIPPVAQKKHPGNRFMALPSTQYLYYLILD
jgi:hypothetical protein